MNNKLNFILERLPKYFNKKEDGNIYKIIEPIGNELDMFINKINYVQNSKFIDYAKNKDLEKLGSLLDIKRLPDEKDESLRARIKSKVPSFIGGGTLNSIIQVVSNFTNIKPKIYEHYKDGMAVYDRFSNGVYSGFNIKNEENNLILEAGIAYLNGNKITSDEKIIDTSSISIDGIYYAFLLNDSSIIIKNDMDYNYDNEILLAEVIKNNGELQLNDKRVFLNPNVDFITLKNTVTIELFLDKNLINYDDFRETLYKTKSAGVSLLIRFLNYYKIILQHEILYILKIRVANSFKIDSNLYFKNLSKIKHSIEFPRFNDKYNIPSLKYSYLNGTGKMNGELKLNGMNNLGVNLYNNSADKLTINIKSKTP